MRIPILCPLAVAITLAITGTCTQDACAQSYSPDHPDVIRAVDKAVKGLATMSESRMGAQAVAGLAVLKAGHSENHPIVQKALRSVLGGIDRRTGRFNPGSSEIYTAGLAACFLIELDPVRYRREIQAVLGFLRNAQQRDGGWGYSDYATGDTSMTQYGVLSAWEAMTAGIPVDRAVADKMAIWLLRTQDPSGGFGYQAKFPRTNQLMRQEEVRPSLSAAGLGSVYICYDLLGFNGTAKRRNSDLPEALRPVNQSQRNADMLRFTSTIPQGQFTATMARGNAWMGKNFRSASQASANGGYEHYALYAWERYWSFRELAEGYADPYPAWYQSGAAHLLKTQGGDGKWQSSCGEMPDTAFGILFLVRSSQKSIEHMRDFGAGNMIGGRGLPTSSDDIVIRDGQVMSKKEAEAGRKMLELVDDPSDPNYDEKMQALGSLSVMETRELVSANASRLTEMAGSRSADARMAAVTSLGKSGDVHHAPILIYALTDPDRNVALAARDALRRISRRWDGYELPDTFTDAQREEAIEKWKTWYRAVRPDAEFEN